MWSPQLEAWFPNGPDSPEIVLIDCDVTFAELWDVSGFERVRHAVEAGRHAELRGGELRK